MKYLALCLMLWASAGCVSMPWSAPRPQGNEPAEVGWRHVPRAPVHPDQITSDNAHALSQALWDELDVVVRTPACQAGCAHCKCSQ
jgi:hypothetical protein